MSDLPDNVIRLADRRPSQEPEPELEPLPVPFARRHLRLVEQPSAPFRLDVFLARGRAVMAEAEHGAAPAAVLPLHARPA
jgi:hypothetical protein